MVNIAGTISKNGINDWLLQRVSALILLIYTLVIMTFFIKNPDFTYQNWDSFFAHKAIKYLTLLSLLALVAHAWIGMWTVFTDYIKPLYLRLTLQILVNLLFIFYLFWGVDIFWS